MLEIYKASCKNLKEIKNRSKTIKRMINRAILYNRQDEIIALTKIYALIYSAFAEISFLKLIHTPHGFSEDKIGIIQKERCLEDKWLKCFELAFLEIAKESKIGEINNKKLKLKKILDEYIIEPSQIRNKIAHGQWLIALNNQSTLINNDTTVRINELDFVRIDILFNIYDKFQMCVEDLIESPHKAHYNYFYTNLTYLEEFINESKEWSFETRKERIISTKKRNDNIKSN
jgi:hypothetical protein